MPKQVKLEQGGVVTTGIPGVCVSIRASASSSSLNSEETLFFGIMHFETLSVFKISAPTE